MRVRKSCLCSQCDWLLYRDADKIFDSVLRHDSSPGCEGLSLVQFVHLYFARLPREEVEDACRKVLKPVIALDPTLDEVPGAREEIRGLVHYIAYSSVLIHRPFLMSVTLSNHDIPLRLFTFSIMRSLHRTCSSQRSQFGMQIFFRT